MSKKDYIKVAQMIKDRIESLQDSITPNSDSTYVSIEQGRINEVKIIMNHMASIFNEDNPHFDYQKFYKACGIAD